MVEVEDGEVRVIDVELSRKMKEGRPRSKRF
jgi:hypothetical protein